MGPVKDLYCTNCGNKIKLGNKFCSNCGAKIETSNTNQTVELKAKPESKANEFYFVIDNHLNKLRSAGLLTLKDGELVTRKWSPKEYLNEIFHSLAYGGFSYFQYKGKPYESEFAKGIILNSKKKVMVRDKEPLLMKDESLEKIADIHIRVNPDLGSGERWGPLYFTGRRFIIDTVEFQAQAYQGQEIEFSLPLNSYWIKPDYTDLFKVVDTDFFFEDGVFRKKRYDTLSFKVFDLKKPTLLGEKGVQCGYLLDGINGEYFFSYYHYLYNLTDEPIEEFSVRIEDLINKAKVTKVSDLIKHTYDCQRLEGAMIETALNYGSRMLKDRPYTYVGYYSRFA